MEKADDNTSYNDEYFGTLRISIEGHHSLQRHSTDIFSHGIRNVVMPWCRVYISYEIVNDSKFVIQDPYKIMPFSHSSFFGGRRKICQTLLWYKLFVEQWKNPGTQMRGWRVRILYRATFFYLCIIMIFHDRITNMMMCPNSTSPSRVKACSSTGLSSINTCLMPWSIM